MKWSNFELQHRIRLHSPSQFANELRWPSDIKKHAVHYKRAEFSIHRRDVKRKKALGPNYNVEKVAINWD